MSDFLTLNAEKRGATGKGVARRLRATGKVPAVFYNTKGESTPIQVSERDLLKVYGQVKRTAVFNIEIADGKKKETHPALIWDIDYYPAKNKIQHVDVFGVDLNKEIKILVPLSFVGVAQGTKVGGKLEAYREAVTLVGKPLALPQKIEVNVESLGINDMIRVADLKLSGGVRADYDNNFAIVAVTLGRAGGDEEAAEGGAPAAAPAAE